jgi:hypothetical protein
MIIRNGLLNRLYIGFAVAFLIACLAPHIVLSWFAEFTTDDYLVHTPGYNFWQVQVHWYMTWTGRYSAAFFELLIHPIRYGNLGYLWIIALLAQFFFLFSLNFFIKSLLFGISKSFRFFIFSIVTLQCYWLLPSSAEAFYWIAGIVTYQLGLCFNLIFFGILLGRTTSFSIKSKIILILLAVIIPGTCEINLLVFCAVLGAVLVFRFYKEREINRFLLLLFFVGVLFSLFSILSPGNTLRSAVLEKAPGVKTDDLFFTIIGILTIAKEQMMQLLLHSPLLITSILFLSSLKLSEFKPVKKPTLIQAVLFLFVAFGVYCFLHFPFVYKEGVTIVPGRIFNVTSIFFIICWFIFLSLVWFSLTTENEVENGNKSNNFYILMLLFLGCFCLSQLLMPNKIQNAWRDLLSGDAQKYSQQVKERIKNIENSKGKNLLVAPLDKMPYSICVGDIEPDSIHWTNQAVAGYFNLASIKIDSSLSSK